MFTIPKSCKLPLIGATSELPSNKVKVRCKLFGGGADSWYLTEYDPSTGEAFGFAVLNGDREMAELGYMYIPELQKLRYPPFGLGVERDRYFTPMLLSDLMEKIRAGGHV